jgi:hypothetical protein
MSTWRSGCAPGFTRYLSCQRRNAAGALLSKLLAWIEEYSYRDFIIIQLPGQRAGSAPSSMVTISDGRFLQSTNVSSLVLRNSRVREHLQLVNGIANRYSYDSERLNEALLVSS